MTTVERDFLAAIIADPDDDAPRLVFADWLEERGDSRADYIRVQCELARRDPDDPAYWPLADRQRELCEQHRKDWLEPYAESLGDARWHIVFERGFPHRLQLDCRYTPLEPERMLPALPTLRELSAYHDVPAAAVVALVQCPQAAQLKRLWIGYSNLRVRGSQAIAKSPYLAGLEYLGLGACRLHNEGLAVIAGSAALPNLRSWTLTDNGLTDAGTAWLAWAEHLTRLESVEFGHQSVGATDGCHVTRLGHRRLAESPTLTSLTTIWEKSLTTDDLPDDREEWLEVTRPDGSSRRVRIVYQVESFW